MTKMTIVIGLIMWDKIGPVGKLFLCLLMARAYATQCSPSPSHLRNDQSHKDLN